MPNNAFRQFDPLTTDALLHYIYGLQDPRDAKIFYIGKGQGNRIFSHFYEADDMIAGKKLPTAKLRRIQEIWEQDLDVEWYIIRSGIQTEQLALDIEASIIDALEISQNGPALNDVAGQASLTRGILAADEVRALAAESVCPRENYGQVFVFPINRAWSEGRDAYDATRRSWAISEKFRNAGAHAVGIANGISRGAFQIRQWIPPIAPSTLWQFEGDPLPDANELLRKNWTTITGHAKGFWQRGGYLIVEFRNSKFRYLRGSSNQEWYSLDNR